MPIAWPQSVFRGLAVGASGVKYSMNAVGPTEGNTKGVRETSAKPARTATDRKPLTNTKDAQTRRGGSLPSQPESRTRPPNRCATSPSNIEGLPFRLMRTGTSGRVVGRPVVACRYGQIGSRADDKTTRVKHCHAALHSRKAARRPALSSRFDG